MILDDPDDDPVDRDDELVDDEDDDAEWLDGLRAINLRVRTPLTVDGPSPGLRHLLDEAHPVASSGLRELVANSISEGTRDAYERDWRDFGSFCRAHRLCDDPVDATALAIGEYLNEMVRDRKAYSTITRRIAAISFGQRLATGGTATYDPLVATALQGARRLLSGRGVTQATPLRLAEMRSIVTSLPIVAERRPAMRRDQFIIALGWASALRASELVSLDVEDLTVVGDSNTGDGGLIIRVRNAQGRRRRGVGGGPVRQPYPHLPRAPVDALHGVAAVGSALPPHRPPRPTTAAPRRPPDQRHRPPSDRRHLAVRRGRLQLALPPCRVRHRSSRPRGARRVHRTTHPARSAGSATRRDPQRVRPARGTCSSVRRFVSRGGERTYR